MRVMLPCGLWMAPTLTLQVTRLVLPSGRTALRVNIDATRRGSVGGFLNHRCAAARARHRTASLRCKASHSLRRSCVRCAVKTRWCAAAAAAAVASGSSQLRRRQHAGSAGGAQRAPGAGGCTVHHACRGGGRGAHVCVRPAQCLGRPHLRVWYGRLWRFPAARASVITVQRSHWVHDSGSACLAGAGMHPCVALWRCPGTNAVHQAWRWGTHGCDSC